MSKLHKSFYTRDNTILIAKELLGKFIYTFFEDELTGGMITETEAYMGPEDAGSHAYDGKKTPRNEAMYAEGGIVYMYICYGIHDMLNVVTGKEGSSHAVLIRAIKPTEGLDTMLSRRGNKNLKNLANGPGSLAKALGLNKNHNLLDLTASEIWIEDKGIMLKEDDIKATARIGLGCKEPYLSIPWRFVYDK